MPSLTGIPPSAPWWYSAGGALGELCEDILERGAGRGAGFGAGREGKVGVVAEVEVSGVEAEVGVSLAGVEEGGAVFLEG